MGKIYKITNTINQKIYVGYTTGPIEKRFARHLLNAKYGENSHLYKAIRKHGANKFQLELLQEDADFTDEVTWISKLRPQYNMTIGGEGGDTSSSPNFKIGVAEYHARKPQESYATYGFVGKKHSASTKELQAKRRKEFWECGDRRAKQSNAVRGKANPMFGKVPANAKTVTIDNTSYPSIAAAARILGVKSIYILRKLYKID